MRHRQLLQFGYATAMNNTHQRKALLAVAFAGGMLNSQLPVLSDNSSDPTVSVTEGIAANTQITPEFRALYLMRLANSYLSGVSKAETEKQYWSLAKATARDIHSSRWDDVLVTWANQVASATHDAIHKQNNAQAVAEPPSAVDENRKLADKALQMALTQLDKSSDKFAKLNLYFIASRSFREVNDPEGERKCNLVLNKEIKSCEDSSAADEQAIKAVASILNSKAYGLVRVHIPDWSPRHGSVDPKREALLYTEKDFKESEKLKLRAAALVDRLSAQNHLRRKAHRDLTLWYQQLGKTVSAEKEKQTLFKLVGYNDDSVLYPQSGACGHPIWWHKEKIVSNMDCGMG